MTLVKRLAPLTASYLQSFDFWQAQTGNFPIRNAPLRKAEHGVVNLEQLEGRFDRGC